MNSPPADCLTLADWRAAFSDDFDAAGARLRAHLASLDPDHPAWIAVATPEMLESELDRVRRLPASAPLRGVPFAVKDNIDVAGWETTAACPAFAYTAAEDAVVVARLRAAGAIVIAKANLDQFATGLVGTRSPYGVVPNPFDPRRICGGSSSGSAVAVARGWVPFSLGTDTAGSGRVPAGFNNIVGLKPTRGALSTRGVVPACASLDCVSVFALTVEDADAVLQAAVGPDPEDIWSRPVPMNRAGAPRVLGIPEQTEWHGDEQQAQAWAGALEQAEAAGFELVPVDFSPLFELAALLYSGPWVAERTAAVGAFLRRHPGEAHPVVEEIIRGGENYSAVDAFQGQYRRLQLLAQIRRLFARVEALLVPTSPTFPTLDEVTAEPFEKNAQLGRYTNFVNLADLCALALPAGRRGDGLPFGVTIIAPAGQDLALQAFARQWRMQVPATLGVTDRPVVVPEHGYPKVGGPVGTVLAVVGAHLRGQPLNSQLTERGAVFLETTRTAPEYRLMALAGTTPPKPGLFRESLPMRPDGIEVELWAVSDAALGALMAEVPAPLGIGTLTLLDGRQVKGFICEDIARRDARDITALGSWRAYLEQQRAPVR
ncbi:MAG: allophanate hydrolase [Halothiobacillaceae bacterium]